MISQFPGNGKGFKISRVSWPENCFYHVHRVHLFSPRYGRAYGVKYWKNELVSDKIEEIKGATKRGAWRFDLYDNNYTPQMVTLDNGLTMDLSRTYSLIQEK